jgi:hypothetical protein
VATKTKPPYSIIIVEPGKRWKIVHRTPGEAVVEHTYFVSRGTFKLDCSCPAGQYKKPCHHKNFIAHLIGEPNMAQDHRRK